MTAKFAPAMTAKFAPKGTAQRAGAIWVQSVHRILNFAAVRAELDDGRERMKRRNS
jgi:hypothetical protein